MAFTTVTGSNGVTSLVGTTGIDVATIVTLSENVFVGGNTADDTLEIRLATGNNVASAYNVRMGGGDDLTTITNSLLNSFISLDGETIAKDGNDTINTGASLIINSEIVGRGGNDVFTGMLLNGSTVNGNTGDDNITVGASSASFVYGGQGTDTITTAGNSSSVLINGNKGSDTINLGVGAFASGSIYGGNGNDTISAANVTVAAATTAGVMLSGDLGDDNVTGSGGVDTINGGDGSDALDGGAGNDAINGGAGNDNIIGGIGADTLTGGAGNDIFRYTAAGQTAMRGNAGFDTITDFAAATSVAPAANGDQIDIVGNAAQVLASGVAATGTCASDADGADFVTLLGNISANFTAGGVGEFYVVTITAGAANAGIAGNYLVSNSDGLAGFNAANDTVIKLNTLSGIAAGVSVI